MLNNALILLAKVRYSITVRNTSGGSVSVSPQGKQYAGTLITVTCSPSSDYQFSSISIVKQDGTTVSYNTVTSGSKYTFVMPSNSVTVNVNYSRIPTYSISLNASGGSVRASKTSGIRAGEVITLTLTPNWGYQYSSLTLNGASLTTNNGSSATFTMPSNNVTVNAVFTAWFTHTLTIGYRHTGKTGEEYGWLSGTMGALSPNNYNQLIAKQYIAVEGGPYKYFVSFTTSRYEGYIAFNNNRANTYHFSYKDDSYDNQAAWNAFRSRNGQTVLVYLSTTKPSWY